jgi:hypothetical protein
MAVLFVLFRGCPENSQWLQPAHKFAEQCTFHSSNSALAVTNLCFPDTHEAVFAIFIVFHRFDAKFC